MSALIASESNYKHRKHALSYVVGIAGINTKAWKNLPYNPHTDKGNIWSCAHILKTYLNKSGGNYFKALTKYKGVCETGRQQAHKVLTNSKG